MGGSSSMEKRKREWPKDEFIDLIFKWSVKDILDETLYENQVEKIPQSFGSVEHYLGSFFFPLLEETRADIAASLKDINESPFAELISFDVVNPNGSLVFDVKVDYWRNTCSDGTRYRTSPGDIVVISNVKPETTNDLQRPGCHWTFAYVTDVNENENDASASFKVSFPPHNVMRRAVYIVFLVNVMPNNNVWNALSMRKNLNIIEEVLRPVHEKRIKQKCDVCSASTNELSVGEVVGSLLSKLNDSQANAIFTCLATMKCHHKASVELISGPPGTGKTRTLSVMLFTLMQMKYRTVTCAPTDVATAQVASKLVKLVRESSKNEFEGFCPLGEILLFGNNNYEDGEDIAEISSNYRVDRLSECFEPITGWNGCVSSMISLLEDCSLIDFARAGFSSTAASLRRCMLIICTHLPICFIREENVERMLDIISLLDFLEGMLFQQAFGVSSKSLRGSCSRLLVLLKDLQRSLGIFLVQRVRVV